MNSTFRPSQPPEVLSELGSDTPPDLLTEASSLPGNFPLLLGEFLLIGHNPA